MARNTLDTYRRKRDFSKTPEPPARLEKGPGGRFVVHEHHASRLHYDLRIEMGGVLKSFAVPKGPSLDPAVRRLAINTEDHPVKYLTFQGSISDGQYGAGQMVIWDAGTYTVHAGEDPLRQYEQGKLHLEFHGGRLRGGFMLIRGREDRQWILFKKRDEAAEDGWEPPMILPYGARTDKPEGYEIPAEALRKQPQGKVDWSAAAPGADADSHAVYQDAPKSKSVKPAPKKRSAPASPSNAPSIPPAAKKAPLPAALEPMLATLADKPFADPLWFFETKWDGWRALLRKDAKGVRLISRSGKSLDDTFPELAALGKNISADECMLDGEIVALDGKGMPRFQLLQNRLKGKRAKAGNGSGNGSAGADGAGAIVFYAFDMPYWNGLDLTACPLVERKALLERVLPKSSGASGPLGTRGKSGKPGSRRTGSGQSEKGAAALRFSPGFEGDGARIFSEAVKLGFEGVVAKLKTSPYRRGRSADWLKVKGKLRQEVVICGYTRPRGARDHFGSLVAGLYRNGRLVFTGHVGGGFNAKSLKQVHGFMAPLKAGECPFAEVPKTNEKVQWIRPDLVAEVEFAEWTQDGIMRQPIFLGLREDKDPKACVRETEQPVERLVVEAESGPVFTHTDKVYWPKDGYTKGDLINYYRAIAPWLLPHLKDRPLILKRYPNGIEAPPFYQHDVKNAPGFVSTVAVEEPAGAVNYALCQNEASLLWLANMGVIPQNPWLSRVPHLDRPDWIVFDLDPQEVDFAEVCRMALYVKEILDGLALKSFPKTSGSRGIHVYVPLKPAYDFAQGLDFAQLVGALMVKRKPDAFTVERSLKSRKRDRIYFDCMQNSIGKSVASVYSVREKPGATVSAALDWAELKRGVRMRDFDIRTMPKRLERKGDLFAGVFKVKNGLEGAFKKLQKLL